jgi:hypothetical protein
LVAEQERDLENAIRAERLRFVASMCQTLGIGVLLLGTIGPLLDADAGEPGFSGDTVLSILGFAFLVVTGQKLVGDAVRANP